MNALRIIVLQIFLIPTVVLSTNAATELSTEDVPIQFKHQLNLEFGTVPYQNVPEALAVIKTSSDSAAIQDALAYLPRIPIKDHDDLMALYQFVKRAGGSAPHFANPNGYDTWEIGVEAATGHLSEATGVQPQDDIATLLDREYTRLHRWRWVHWLRWLPTPPITERSLHNVSIDIARVQCLIWAAGNGNNQKARPALWKFVDWLKDDQIFGHDAMEALAKIGNADDLERFITMLRKNPSLRFNFGYFGATAGPRLLRELDAPDLTDDLRREFAENVGYTWPQDNLASLMLLMNNKSDLVRHAAVKGFAPRLKPNDVEILRELMVDPDTEVRLAAYTAIEHDAWSDAYVPLLTAALKTEDKDFLRDYIIYVLRHHGRFKPIDSR